MNNRIIICQFLLITSMVFAQQTHAKVKTPEPCGPVPTENQLRWQDMEMYAFIHYSMITYTDQEWGYGNEDLSLFNPSDLDPMTLKPLIVAIAMTGLFFSAAALAIPTRLS